MLRQGYHPGEYLFVDDAGDTLPIPDPQTGAVERAQVCVATLGYSNRTFVALHRDQTRASWIAGHRDAFAYFGGVPRLVVPDNPKPLVLDTRHDVVLDPRYQEMAAPYHVGIVPARVRKPKDKAKGEGHVLIAERAILAPLRHEPLAGWGRAQERVAALTDALNTRPFQALAGSRRTLFEADERAALQPLPATHSGYGAWRFGLTVGRDYPIHLEHAAYSVPWRWVGEVVDARLTSLTVEIFHQYALALTEALPEVHEALRGLDYGRLDELTAAGDLAVLMCLITDEWSASTRNAVLGNNPARLVAGGTGATRAVSGAIACRAAATVAAP